MPQPLEIIRFDPLLAEYREELTQRLKHYDVVKSNLLDTGQSLYDFANAHLYFGFHHFADRWVFREWAPGAASIYLIGDFNDWNRQSHSLEHIGKGVWEIVVPGKIPHGSKIRLEIHTENDVFERIPSYIIRTIQDPITLAFDGQIWQPATPYQWGDNGYCRNQTESLLIYESHIGMSGEMPGVASYSDYRQQVLPRIGKLGYNAIQLMAIAEHPYYASFGYQVSSFFAASSRFGTPEELKQLIDAAHQMGIAVFLDVVHSHASANEVEGLARFDGTEYQYFHSGSKGTHPQWGTKLFDYGKNEVIHFLLSNLKFWLEEYHFDGFRFDGVTSMLYHDHGLGEQFDHYSKYFGSNIDLDAIAYLQLAATLCKDLKKDCILIAEDMSGMPGMCLPIEAGGLGFDYRLAMGVPDFWVRTLRDLPDEQWSMGGLWHELNQRRPGEKVIGYCESHDQALVGDKTIMFWLADAEMYWHMDRASESYIIDRAMSLHKMIRLITCLCAGEGYLNFMGNEFGHPEWIDFPREGNGNSYHYARRQWRLADSDLLRYSYLQEFDRAMISFVRSFNVLDAPAKLWLHDEVRKVLIFQKANFLCAFNFHPSSDYTATFPFDGDMCYCKALDTNWSCFGVPEDNENSPMLYKKASMTITIKKRSGIVWGARENYDTY